MSSATDLVFISDNSVDMRDARSADASLASSLHVNTRSNAVAKSTTPGRLRWVLSWAFFLDGIINADANTIGFEG